MPLHLIPPGRRKGNKTILARGRVAGRLREIDTGTTDEKAARRLAAEAERRFLASSPPRPGEAIGFARAVDLYTDFKRPSKREEQFLARLKTELGTKRIAEIRHIDLVNAANALYPGRSPATKNRAALRPAAAVLHYMASDGLCPWLRVTLFKEPKPKTRAVDREIAMALVNSAEGDQQLLLLWLFRQGPRITDALKVAWEQINLRRRVVLRHIGKTDEWIEEPLQDEVWELLANREPKKGRLFPWNNRWQVYRWLGPLTERLGVAFTPHMARHSLGKWLNEDGASLRTIMDTLHHRDIKSSARYQSTDLEVVRATGAKLGRLTPQKTSGAKGPGA